MKKVLEKAIISPFRLIVLDKGLPFIHIIIPKNLRSRDKQQMYFGFVYHK